MSLFISASGPWRCMEVQAHSLCSDGCRPRSLYSVPLEREREEFISTPGAVVRGWQPDSLQFLAKAYYVSGTLLISVFLFLQISLSKKITL